MRPLTKRLRGKIRFVEHGVNVFGNRGRHEEGKKNRLGDGRRHLGRKRGGRRGSDAASEKTARTSLGKGQEEEEEAGSHQKNGGKQCFANLRRTGRVHFAPSRYDEYYY